MSVLIPVIPVLYIHLKGFYLGMYPFDSMILSVIYVDIECYYKE